MKKLFIVISVGLILSGCYHLPTKAPSALVASPSPIIQPSGNIDEELKSIDKELQQAETEDLPQVDEKSLGL